jgi:hypothetical protein
MQLSEDAKFVIAQAIRKFPKVRDSYWVPTPGDPYNFGYHSKAHSEIVLEACGGDADLAEIVSLMTLYCEGPDWAERVIERNKLAA